MYIMEKLLSLMLFLIVTYSIVLVTRKRKKKTPVDDSKSVLKSTNYQPEEPYQLLKSLDSRANIFLDDQQKAEDFMRNRDLKPAKNSTKFFSVYLDEMVQYLWLSRTEKGGYYTFNVDGYMLQKHKRQPNFTDICPMQAIRLNGKLYNVINDTQIIPAINTGLN